MHLSQGEGWEFSSHPLRGPTKVEHSLTRFLAVVDHGLRSQAPEAELALRFSAAMNTDGHKSQDDVRIRSPGVDSYVSSAESTATGFIIKPFDTVAKYSYAPRLGIGSVGQRTGEPWSPNRWMPFVSSGALVSITVPI